MSLLMILVAVIPGQQPQAAIPVISMEDQFEKPHDVRSSSRRCGRADLRRSQERRRQQVPGSGSCTSPSTPRRKACLRLEALASGMVLPVPEAPPGARSPDVLAIPVACVGKVPALVRAIIRGQFRSASPDVPVWLDFDDLMKTDFGFQAGVPNIVVLDALGDIVISRHGNANAQESTKRLGGGHPGVEARSSDEEGLSDRVRKNLQSRFCFNHILPRRAVPTCHVPFRRRRRFSRNW